MSNRPTDHRNAHPFGGNVDLSVLLFGIHFGVGQGRSNGGSEKQLSTPLRSMNRSADDRQPDNTIEEHSHQEETSHPSTSRHQPRFLARTVRAAPTVSLLRRFLDCKTSLRLSSSALSEERSSSIVMTSVVSLSSRSISSIFSIN